MIKGSRYRARGSGLRAQGKIKPDAWCLNSPERAEEIMIKGSRCRAQGKIKPDAWCLSSPEG